VISFSIDLFPIKLASASLPNKIFGELIKSSSPAVFN